MEFSWTSLKISIAGAKLSHLSRKDKIWDHGSMTEQARIIFYLVQRAKANGSVDSLRKHCSVACFEKLKIEMERANIVDSVLIKNPVIKVIAITDVVPGKRNKPDMFSALINGISKDEPAEKFKAHCTFVRHGEWWMLGSIKIKQPGF
ncbi:MAG TPA: hypothetical protein VFH08_18400 [Chitinophagaceae bacterium]|nr:hypothetical protein [Chitinophagaceae bacterium]